MKNSLIYVTFFGLLVILAFAFPGYIRDYAAFINWKTIATITGLIITTTGIEQSAMLDSLTVKMIKHSGNELGLAMRLVALSVIFSAFLTNDVSLFILIPITLHIQKYIKNDVGKLIVFEAIGVNVGSALTPIGNPQNIYLSHKWGLNSIGFISAMMPIFLISCSVLAIFIMLSFKKAPLSYSEENIEKRKKNSGLFWISVVFIASYFVFLNSPFAVYVLLAIIIIAYLISAKNVLISSDWGLILLFCIMFIDFNIIARIPFVSKLITSANLGKTSNLFAVSALLSQIISNVPASIFLSGYSSNYRIIAYGVNVGGNGFIIASLANIIALRLSKKSLFREFHKYSIPFLLITFTLVLLILRIR